MARPLLTITLACLLAACGAQATSQPAPPTPSTSPSPVAVETPTPPPATTVIATPVATPAPTPRPAAISTPRTPVRATPPPVMTASVGALMFAFSPSSLHIRVGTRVTFTNRDGATHTFTADAGIFNSGNVPAGQSYSFTFVGAGSFAYHCRIHASMTGTITVSS